jgi:DNA repair exonuclease SbcCD ATPase subunit
MKKYFLVALLAILTVPFALSAQTKLEDNLKAVMLLFDKSRKESEAKIEELTQANEEMMASITQLKSDLENAETLVEELQSQNMLLRSKISEVAVNELETAALTITTDIPVASKPAKAKKSESKPKSPEEEPIPDFTPNALKKLELGTATQNLFPKPPFCWLILTPQPIVNLECFPA